MLSYTWLTNLDKKEVRDQFVNLMIINMIRERIGRQEVLLPININCYNFRKQQIHLGQISLVETMSKVKNMSPFWKFLIFLDKWLLLWLLWLTPWLVDLAEWTCMIRCFNCPITGVRLQPTVQLQLYRMRSKKLKQLMHQSHLKKV